MRTLVIIPTYNELENLPRIVARIHAAAPDADILVADDASPDGTGALADELAARDSRIKVLHRGAKQGLGPAYLEGFAWGLARGYEVLVEMDADGSHRPEQLPRLLGALGPLTSLVIGSRWVRGGRVHEWPFRRFALSRLANLYTQIMLGLRVRDATAGYRAYRADLLQVLLQGRIASQGYCFQVDMTRRAGDIGAGVVEVPIDFDERTLGTSKMDGSIVREALIRVTCWGLEHHSRRLRRLVKGLR